MAPVNCLRADSTWLLLTATRPRDVTSPSVSPVVVVTPNRISASYLLSAPKVLVENFVASPRHTGSKPLASGSSVPTWPAFAADNNRLTHLLAACDVIPTG